MVRPNFPVFLISRAMGDSMTKKGMRGSGERREGGKKKKGGRPDLKLQAHFLIFPAIS